MEMVAPRKTWIGVILSIIMPGLGQVYCGELLRGGCFLVFFVFSPFVLARITVELPDSMMIIGMGVATLAALVSYIYGIVDSFRLARGASPHYKPAAYNTHLFYLAVWLVGTATILATDQYLKTNIVHAYKIVTSSMAPQVLKGDYVLAKMPAYRNRPLKVGDVVILIYPDDRSKVLIRKITALPGDHWLAADNTTGTVPHGMVVVKGTGAGGAGAIALDSTVFGPVDMRDIIGRVTQVYFSLDGMRLRWERIAALINP